MKFPQNRVYVRNRFVAKNVDAGRDIAQAPIKILAVAGAILRQE